MKHGIHPDYASVVFRDKAGDLMFLSASTLTSDETVQLDGVTYPVVDVDISTSSHPFWTGQGRVLDAEGRVEKFNRRYGVGA